MAAIKSIDSKAFDSYWPGITARYAKWFNPSEDVLTSFQLQALTRSITAPGFVEKAALALVKDGRLDLGLFAYLESSPGATAVPCYVKAFREGYFTMNSERAHLAGVIENHVAHSQEALEFVFSTIKDSREDFYIRNGLIEGLTQVNPLSGREIEFTAAELQDRIALLDKLESELAPSDAVQRSLIQAMKQNLASGL